MRVAWADDALIDIERHTSYVSQFNPAAAAALARQLLDAGNTLKLFPHRGRPGSEPGTREIVAVHPYIVVYEITHDTVVVLRVWHGAQQR
jgi:addiction module RelE/StbE family toxin